MKKILIIEDEQSVADVVKSAIESGLQGTTCEVELDFGKSAARIAEIRPDAIVLDLMKGHESTELPGERAWSFVWEQTFCPIIIYTGSDADLNPPVPVDHPFVKRIQKGGGTQAKVVQTLKDFAPATGSVRRLRDEIDAVIHKVLRDTAGGGFVPVNDPKYLLHAGRRRVAAAMDDSTVMENRSMECWEHYLVPAIGSDCLTGDILHERGTTRTPENFRLMVSPSCDLARRAKNLTGALVAKCHAPSSMLEKFNRAIQPENEKDLTKQLMSLVLSQGAWNGLFPLPAFAQIIPEMVANLKDVEVLPVDALHSDDDTKVRFDRVASIDSPFREQVAWSFLTTAARPGMPDRDLKSWAEAIAKASSTKPSQSPSKA